MDSLQADNRSLFNGLAIALIGGVAVALLLALSGTSSQSDVAFSDQGQDIARTGIANAAAASLLSSIPYGGDQAFDDQLVRFSLLDFLNPEAMFCVIDRTGRVVFSSAGPSSVGEYVGDLTLAGNAGAVSDLLAGAASWSGISAFPHGAEQVITFHYWDSFDGIVAVHTPLGVVGLAGQDLLDGSVVARRGTIILLVALMLLALWLRSEQRRAGLRVDLASAREELAQGERSRVMAQLASGATHDLKNMMTVIRGGAELLRAGQLTPREQLLSEGIETASATGLELCERLLTLRAEQPLAPRWLNLHAACVAFIADWSGILGSRVRLVLGTATPQALVYVDALQLQQTLLNLVLNCHALDVADLQLTIEIVPVAKTPTDVYPAPLNTPCWRLSLQDNGPGLPPHLVRRFLHSEKSSEHAKSDDSNSGLGLLLVSDAIARAHGCVRVETGAGTRFELFFPRRTQS